MYSLIQSNMAMTSKTQQQYFSIHSNWFFQDYHKSFSQFQQNLIFVSQTDNITIPTHLDQQILQNSSATETRKNLQGKNYDSWMKLCWKQRQAQEGKNLNKKNGK